MNETILEKTLQKVQGVRSLYIETGTGTCATLDVAQKFFSRLISVEIDTDLYRAAIQSHWDNWNIRFILGDSYYWTHHIEYSVNEPAVWLLDAHFVDGEVSMAETGVTPVVKELDSILRSDYDHVILIDDARLFTGDNGYPTKATIKNMANNFKYKFLEKDDIFILERL